MQPNEIDRASRACGEYAAEITGDGELGMKVALGIWISSDLAYNEQEIENALKLLRTNRTATAPGSGCDRIWPGRGGSDTLIRRLAPIAQMVERVLGKDEVCGSIPHRGSVDPGGSATAVGLESG